VAKLNFICRKVGSLSISLIESKTKCYKKKNYAMMQMQISIDLKYKFKYNILK